MSVDTGTSIPAAVAEAALAGRRLEAAQVQHLATIRDILALGALADDVRRQRHGTAATFVRVHELDLAAPETWAAPPERAGEVRLTGTALSIEALVEAVRRARTLAGGRALRGGDLTALWSAGGAALLGALAQAGLDSVARVRPGTEAVAAVRAARAAGLAVQVVGLDRPVDDRAAWLLEVRALVDAVGGVEAVAPLADAVDPSAPTTGFDDARSVALARLALESVPHIQVDWQRHGPKLAQVALTLGADDLDLVSASDDTTRGPRRAPIEELRRNVAAAGLTPLERDGRFGRVPA